MGRISELLGRDVSVESFNGIIGSKNQTYSITPLNYDNPEAYIYAWDKKQDAIYIKEKHTPYEKASHRIHNLMQDDLSKEFINNYLARIYFNKKSKY